MSVAQPTAPRTWSAGENVTAAEMNNFRDNLNYLLQAGPILASKSYAAAANLSVGNGSPTILDSTNLAIPNVSVPTSGKVKLTFSGLVQAGASSNVAFAFSTSNANNTGMVGQVGFFNGSGSSSYMTFESLVTGLTAGSTVSFYLQGWVPNGANVGTIVMGVIAGTTLSQGVYLEATAL